MNLFEKRALEWKVGHCPSAAELPATWIGAKVPGAVQLDWARSEGKEPYFFSDNCKEYAWTESVFWRYRAILPELEFSGDRELWWVCEGVDYRFQVFLEGRLLHEQEGMFTPVSLNLSAFGAQPGDSLDVVVFPPPMAHETTDRAQSAESCKPAVSYGWDFHPRLIPSGICGDAFLEVRPSRHIQGISIDTSLSEKRTEAKLSFSVDLAGKGKATLQWSLLAPDQTTVCLREKSLLGKRISFSTKIKKPLLWWPHDQGAPNLYTLCVEMIDDSGAVLQTITRRIGFRSLRLVMCPDGWEDPAGLPAGRRPVPITVEINGRQIFAKGSNWVGPHIFSGETDTESYRALLSEAKNANMNFLRCWGGAATNKDAFYDLCDEMGILVWQDFPLGGGFHHGSSENYLATLDRESRSILARLRTHACLAVWCGGNELFCPWTRMSEHDDALRLLQRNCYDLDPSRPFLATTPLEGMRHGNYLFRSLQGEEVYQIFKKQSATAYVEFGCPSVASVETLKTILPEKDLWPPRPGTAWETHHAFGAWDQAADSWLMLEIIESYFGKTPDLQTLVAQSQWLASEGFKCLFEEARRQKPHCSMALNWCFNEPWPTAANNSLIEWPCRPKPALRGVADACRPTLASAQIEKFSWQPGEEFSCKIYLLNDSPDPIPAGTIECFLSIGETSLCVGTAPFPKLPPNTNWQGLTLSAPIPPSDAPTSNAPNAPMPLTLSLRISDHPNWNSSYQLLLTHSTTIP